MKNRVYRIRYLRPGIRSVQTLDIIPKTKKGWFTSKGEAILDAIRMNQIELDEKIDSEKMLRREIQALKSMKRRENKKHGLPREGNGGD